MIISDWCKCQYSKNCTAYPASHYTNRPQKLQQKTQGLIGWKIGRPIQTVRHCTEEWQKWERVSVLYHEGTNYAVMRVNVFGVPYFFEWIHFQSFSWIGIYENTSWQSDLANCKIQRTPTRKIEETRLRTFEPWHSSQFSSSCRRRPRTPWAILARMLWE